MNGNIIDAAKNLLGGDFTTELRFRYITIGDTMVELKLDGGAYMVVVNCEVSQGKIRYSSDYTDYKILDMNWDGNGPRLDVIGRLPIQTTVYSEHFSVVFAVRAI